jgi:hypothetical protein
MRGRRAEEEEEEVFGVESFDDVEDEDFGIVEKERAGVRELGFEEGRVERFFFAEDEDGRAGILNTSTGATSSDVGGEGLSTMGVDSEGVEGLPFETGGVDNP